MVVSGLGEGEEEKGGLVGLTEVKLGWWTGLGCGLLFILGPKDKSYWIGFGLLTLDPDLVF